MLYLAAKKRLMRIDDEVPNARILIHIVEKIRTTNKYTLLKYLMMTATVSPSKMNEEMLSRSKTNLLNGMNSKMKIDSVTKNVGMKPDLKLLLIITKK